MSAMLVETFEVTEVDCTGVPEVEAEALEIIEKLGLEGQKKLVTKDESGVESRCPYRKMTAEEKFIYQTLCPTESTLHDFADSPIPVRVLQVAAHAVDLFDDVLVWSAENADVKDPVLVGRNGSYGNHEFFMLARWGEVLEPLSNLKIAATEVAREKIKTRLQDIRQAVDASIASIGDATFDKLLKMRTPVFYE